MAHKETLNSLVKLVYHQRKILKLNQEMKRDIANVKINYSCFCVPQCEQRAEIIDNIPNFWYMAFLGHPQLSLLLDEEEEECLRYLRKIDIKRRIENGYYICFTFNRNPYFSNRFLYIEYQAGDLGAYTYPIRWYEGKDITQKDKLLSTEVGKYGETYQNSFFAWYNNQENATQNSITDMIMNELWTDPLKYILSINDSSAKSSDNSKSEF